MIFCLCNRQGVEKLNERTLMWFEKKRWKNLAMSKNVPTFAPLFTKGRLAQLV